MEKVFIGIGSTLQEESDFPALQLSIALYCKAELLRHNVMACLSHDETQNMHSKIMQCKAYMPDLAMDIQACQGEEGVTLYHTRYGGKGKLLAQNIEDEVFKLGQNSYGLQTQINDAGRDHAPFIRELRCPSVVIKIGVAENILDAPDKQRRFGVAFAKAMLRTLGVTWKPDNNSAVQAAINSLRQRAGLTQQSVEYLMAYPYARELLVKLAAMEGA